MWLVEIACGMDPSELAEALGSLRLSLFLDIINENKMETTEGINRLKNFVKLLLDEGILRPLKTEDDVKSFKKALNEKKKDINLQKRAASILGYDDFAMFEKYKLNPFDMFQISGRNNLVLLHYNNNFFSLSALAGKDRSRLWKPAVRQARGVIFRFEDLDGDHSVKIVSKGYEKFFNLNEIGIQESSVENIMKLAEKYRYSISTKWDGHMGLFYLDENGDIQITTKGILGGKSFKEQNDQLFRELVKSGKINHDKLKRKMEQGYIPIVEIISAHTIVHVPYKINDMILTGVNKIDPRTGEFERELSDNEVTEFAKEIGFTRTLPITGRGKEQLEEIIRKTAEEKFVTPEDIKEGYVVTFYDNDNDIVGRVKIKYKDYIKLMKSDKVSIKKIISVLATGSDLNSYKLYMDGMADFEELLPDVAEIVSFVLTTYNKYRASADDDKKTIIDKKRKFYEEIQSKFKRDMASMPSIVLSRIGKYENAEVSKPYAYAAYSKISKVGVAQILGETPSIIRKHINITG